MRSSIYRAPKLPEEVHMISEFLISEVFQSALTLLQFFFKCFIC